MLKFNALPSQEQILGSIWCIENGKCAVTVDEVEIQTS